MTFSIVARDPASGALGVAIASRFFAVGGICPFVFPGSGALATQALGYPPHGPLSAELLGAGHSPSAVIDTLLRHDPARESRQVHIIDATGNSAAHTGAECIGWAGARAGADVSIAGNMLTGSEVLEAAHSAYEAAARAPFAERLLDALEAAQVAGGDRRGQQAAALLVHGPHAFPMVSLRVDDDPGAVPRLRALHVAAAADYYPYVRKLFPPEMCTAVLG